ncbi:MAG: DUF3352 domain-containing protein [Cyanobacteria bacterium P01_F01_bin.4]
MTYRWWRFISIGLLPVLTAPAMVTSALSQTLSVDPLTSPAPVEAIDEPLPPHLPTSLPPHLSTLDPATQLPASVAMALMIDTTENTWATLSQFELFAKTSDFTGAPLNPSSLPFLPNGLNYLETVQPWIGDSAIFALLAAPSPGSVTFSERAILIAPVANPEPATGFIDEVALYRGADPEQTTYKGTDLWLWPEAEVSFGWPEDDWPEDDWPEASPSPLPPVSPSPLPPFSPPQPFLPDPEIFPTRPDASDDFAYTIPGLAIARVENYLIFANDVETLKIWIEYQYPGGPTLSEHEAFINLRAHPEAAGAIATLYGDMGELSKFELGDALSNIPAPLPLPQPNLRDQATAARFLKGVTVETLIYPQAKGLRLEARLNRNDFLPGFPATPADTDDGTILSLVPAPTYFLGSGQDIAGLWRDVATALSLNEFTYNIIESARSLVAFTLGLDLDTDILGWMDGEYTLFFFPSRSGLLNSFFPGLNVEPALMLETSDRTAAEKALTAFDDFVGPDVATPVTVNQQPAVSWNFDDGSGASSVLSHSWVADDTLVLTTGTGAMGNLLNPPAFEPLTEHSTFINATESLPQPNDGYFYANAGSTLSLIYGLLPFEPGDPFAQTITSFLGSFHSLSMTSSSTSEYVQFDVLLGLAQAEERERLQD